MAINAEVFRKLQEINAQVERVSEVMVEVTAASDQQSHGMEQIHGWRIQMLTRLGDQRTQAIRA